MTLTNFVFVHFRMWRWMYIQAGVRLEKPSQTSSKRSRNAMKVAQFGLGRASNDWWLQTRTFCTLIVLHLFAIIRNSRAYYNGKIGWISLINMRPNHTEKDAEVVDTETIARCDRSNILAVPFFKEHIEGERFSDTCTKTWNCELF